MPFEHDAASIATSRVSDLISEGASHPVSVSPTPESRESRRIPGLDGMRAVSILLVIAWHLRSSGSAQWLLPLSLIDTGNVGVRVFFVISGFLITSVLLAEYACTGTIDLRRFYIRRAFRIMPVFYVFLVVIGVAGALGIVDAPLSAIVRAGTYSADYTWRQTTWAVGHTWSLAVEEQFYLLWPGLILLLGLRRSFVGAALVLLLSPTVRVLALLGHWPTFPRYAFEGVADALATGCLLAYARPWLWDRARYRRMLESRMMSLWPLAITAIAAANVRWRFSGAIVDLPLAAAIP